MTPETVGASFRDPAGFVFESDGVLYRQIQASYRADFELLQSSGLYEALTSSGRLVRHEEVPLDKAAAPGAFAVIRPERVPFVSYPYEWCFSQLRDAALLTLDVQATAMEHGMSLRDASAYNVQFVDGRPVLIDTLSFERIPEGRPWVAYGQFCRHFLAPLALMSLVDIRMGGLMRVHIDGIPLDLAASLLPKAARVRAGLWLHLRQHAKMSRRHEGAPEKAVRTSGRAFSMNALRGLVSSLRRAVEGLTWRPSGAWAGYYDEGPSYTEDSAQAKREIVGKFLAEAGAADVWDLGANTGAFSKIAASQGARVVSFDMDPACVEAAWSSREPSVLPLVMDLSNPSPGLGWAGQEREALAARGPAGLVLALALVHHLAIGNNVPLGRVAAFFAELSPWALVEFVPKEDAMVQRLLAAREDIFDDYTQDGFERAFGELFTVQRREPIPGSARTLYLLRRR